MRPISKPNKNACAISVAKSRAPISVPVTSQRTIPGLDALLTFATPCFALLAFSGASFYWVVAPYDQMRIVQVILLILLGGYTLLQRQPMISLDKTAISTGLWLLLGLVIITVYDSREPAHAAADAALYGLLASAVWAQSRLLKAHPIRAAQAAAVIALAPLLTLIYLPISLIIPVDSSTGMSWHQSFSNIRMLDDALLPCLFLLWQRPAWLGNTMDQPTANQKRQIALTCAITAISTLYLLAFFLDGSRAGLLAIGLGIAVAAAVGTPWQRLRLPLGSLVLAAGLYLLLNKIVPNLLAHDLIRTDSSLRDQLWQKALSLWQTHPLLGIGGDNFALAEPWLLNAHPHNLIVQLISEWGIAGLLGLFLLLPLALRILLKRRVLPSFAIAAMIAVLIDSMLSGVLIYPLSQMLGLWVLAWLIAALPNAQAKLQPEQRQIVDETDTNIDLGQWSFKVLTLIAIITMLIVHGRDMVCINCMSIDHENAPRFWQYGRALHLVPQSEVRLIDDTH